MYFWDEKYSDDNYEWGLEPSLAATVALNAAREHGYSTVLDIGCGYGRDTLYLARNGMEATGIDNSSAGIEMAVKLAADLDIDARFISKDVMKSDIEAEGYDLVLMSYTRHLFLARERFELVSIVHSALRTGGGAVEMVPSIEDENYGTGNEIEKGTYHLRGKALHCFDRDEVMRDYSDFTVDSLEEADLEERHSDGRNHKHKVWMLVARKE